jgi:hypothetical protein
MLSRIQHYRGVEMMMWTEAESLFSRRGQLLEDIATIADEIKSIDDRLEFLRSMDLRSALNKN